MSRLPAPTIPTRFFFNDTATTEIYTLSLHDALPICHRDLRQHAEIRKGRAPHVVVDGAAIVREAAPAVGHQAFALRSEEHTSELQSHSDLVCRLLLEKKNRLPSGSAATPCVRSRLDQ